METEEQRDLWVKEFIELEPVLTVFELLTLISIETDNSDFGVLEPVWTILGEENIPAWKAMLVFSESTLLQLSQQRRLIRLGLVQLCVDSKQELSFNLTEKGAEAVAWWTGGLEDMGFRRTS
jgi:hypothetical protein